MFCDMAKWPNILLDKQTGNVLFDQGLNHGVEKNKKWEGKKQTKQKQELQNI